MTSVSTVRGHNKKAPSANQKESTARNPVHRHLDVGLPASGTVRNTRPLFKPCSLWYSFRAAWAGRVHAGFQGKNVNSDVTSSFLYFLEDNILESQKLKHLFKNWAPTLGKNQLRNVPPNVSHLLNMLTSTWEDNCYLIRVFFWWKVIKKNKGI